MFIDDPSGPGHTPSNEAAFAVGAFGFAAGEAPGEPAGDAEATGAGVGEFGAGVGLGGSVG